MDKNQDSYLTPSQLTFILVGVMIGAAALTLPLDVLEYAKQDGWISCILGAVYPIYFIFMAQYMHKKFPEQNILMISKKFCGNFVGTILNLIFTLFFLLILTEAAAGIANVLIIYMVAFLNRYRIIIVLLLAPAFVAYKGIKTIGKVNEVLFYITLAAFFIPLAALKEGSILNIMPVFGSGIINIIKSTKETMLAYGAVEIIFLIYPFFKDNKKLKKCGIISIIITGTIYVWFTFVSIFYLGIDIIPVFIWPVVTVTEAVNIPVINSFRYVFMSLYTIIMLRVLSNCYYAFAFGISEITQKISRKSVVIITYPLICYLSLLYKNPTIRGDFLAKAIPIYAIFNVVYVFIIVLLIAIIKDKK